MEISAEFVRAVLDYNAETGELHWRSRRGSAQAGDRAGTLAPHGALVIRLGRKLHYAHRLAWLYSYGRWPNGVIDHKNGNAADNRLANLRECSQADNAKNVAGHRDTASRLKGAYRDGKRWTSRIRVGGKNKYLGAFDTAEDAAAAYDAAALQYFGEFACLSGDRNGNVPVFQQLQGGRVRKIA